MQFCERQLCGWFTQPSNTWSNLAFIFVGIYLAWRARRDDQGALILVGLSSIFLGIGSWLFHMTSAFVFEILDLLGMFLISGLMVSLNLQRLLSLKSKTVFLIYSILTALSVVSMLIWKPAGVPVFAAQIAAALTLEMLLHIRRDEISYKNFLLMVASFTVAFAIWNLDITGRVCNPDNHWVTGHALWHLLNAAAIYFIYRFYEQFKFSAKGHFTLKAAK